MNIPSSLERNHLYEEEKTNGPWTLEEKQITFLRSSPRKDCITIVCIKKKSMK